MREIIQKILKNKKIAVELTVIFFGIGGIFLTIPIPESVEAKIALFNIQIIWLLSISFLIVFWFLFFLVVSAWTENKIEEKVKINLSGGFSSLVLFVGFWLILNLWKYIIALYKDSLINFFKLIISPVKIILMSFFFSILLSIQEKSVGEKKLPLIKYFVLILSFSFFESLLFTLFHLSFVLNDWFKFFYVNFFIYLVLGSVVLAVVFIVQKRKLKTLGKTN